ncbi:MAG: DUF402 domain-containing protein [Chloroflexota bacterium]
MSRITVYKLDASGKKLLSYPGEVVSRGETWVHLRAIFNVPDADIGPAVLYKGDIFDEWFYTDRYYNVFRVAAPNTGELRGWYCNITRPAVITEDSVSSDDLALDVFITADGEVHMLDEDEFEELALPVVEQEKVRDAVDEIIARYRSGQSPFS